MRLLGRDLTLSIPSIETRTSWVVASVSLVLLALPSNHAVWSRLHGITRETPPAFIGEDASAVSAMFPGEGARWRVTVIAINGARF